MTPSSTPVAQIRSRRLVQSKALRIALAGLLVLVIAYQVLRPRKQRLPGALSISVAAEPITHFARADAGRARFGKLDFRGGLVLTSPSPYFGGWSALALDAHGRRLLAISDAGAWMTGELTYADGRPSGIAHAVVGPLLDATGQPFAHARDRDSEGLAVVSGTLEHGEALISFEVNDRIGRFPIDAGGVGPQQGSVPLPSETAQMKRNVGLESVCRLKTTAGSAGPVVTLVERFPGTTDAHTGWIGAGDGNSWRRLSLAVIDDYDLTDCAGLPDGGMLVLERRFHARDWGHGPRMRVRRVTAAEIASATVMRGETLLDAGPDEDIDNMEGLAVHFGPAGEMLITIISDDNFNHSLQRTVLLQFALPRTAQ